MTGSRILSRSARRLQKQRSAPASIFVRPFQAPSAFPATNVHSNRRLQFTTAVSEKALFSTSSVSNHTADLSNSYFPNRLETSGLSAVFEPRSVAVIGATDRIGSVGRTLVNNLIISNKAGGDRYKIYPINPTRQTVLGLPCYSTLKDVPGDVDMAVIVTPAKSCVNVMKECAAKGVQAAVVISAGQSIFSLHHISCCFKSNRLPPPFQVSRRLVLKVLLLSMSWFVLLVIPVFVLLDLIVLAL